MCYFLVKKRIIYQMENSFRNIYVLQIQQVLLESMVMLLLQIQNFDRSPKCLLHFLYKTKLVVVLIKPLN